MEIKSSFPLVSSALFSHNVSFTTTQFSNPNLKSYKLNNRRTLIVSALGADTFDGTTLAVIGGGSVATIAAVISLADPEKRRQLQAEEVGGQVHVSSGSGSFFRGYLLKKSISDLLGAGAVKKVYMGFDQEEGRDVAWNQVKLRSFGGDPSVLKRLFSEIKVLQTLENENIIVLYSFWRDTKNNTLNFITEACASGNLRDYKKKHKRVSLKALKNWSRQILRGLEYLHNHEPCIIHRDLNCSNIFINGNIRKNWFPF
ncbi:unnamed protein product [Lactuca virosa]|uniref:non-specific serine/threonine protein kinase n=1 Tax=Lactuca virosa TaxID=75947 RepID=A0AAU9NBX8_9ASTR|nr:unnamed protein product [Lactuca virosa]